MFVSSPKRSDSGMSKEDLLVIQVSVCYIVKHLEDREGLSVHICFTWCDIILISKLHRRARITPLSSIHSLKISNDVAPVQ